MCYLTYTAICVFCNREFKADRVCDHFQPASAARGTEEWHSESYTFYEGPGYVDKCPRCMTEEERIATKRVVGPSRNRNKPKRTTGWHDEPLTPTNIEREL